MTEKFAVNTYLFFNGRCEEAIEFYKKTIGAEVLMLMRYKEAPPQGEGAGCGAPIDGEKVMHSRIAVNGSTIMLSDGPCTGKFDGFSLSLTGSSTAEAERLFAALSEGGKVEMPLAKTFFSPAFGMLTDPFGVKWMVHVEPSA